MINGDESFSLDETEWWDSNGPGYEPVEGSPEWCAANPALAADLIANLGAQIRRHTEPLSSSFEE
jgi:hypothetical protein